MSFPGSVSAIYFLSLSLPTTPLSPTQPPALFHQQSVLWHGWTPVHFSRVHLANIYRGIGDIRLVFWKRHSGCSVKIALEGGEAKDPMGLSAGGQCKSPGRRWWWLEAGSWWWRWSETIGFAICLGVCIPYSYWMWLSRHSVVVSQNVYLQAPLATRCMTHYSVYSTERTLTLHT